MKDLKRREMLLRKLESHCNFVRGSLSSVCAKCNRAKCICDKRTSRKAYRLTYKDREQKTKIVYVPSGKIPEIKKMIGNYKKIKNIINDLVETNIKIFKDS